MPAAAIAPLTPYLSMAAIALLYYRRIRRSFGRQPWKPVSTAVRTVVLVIAAAALAFAVYGPPQVWLGIAVERWSVSGWARCRCATRMPNGWKGAAGIRPIRGSAAA